MVHGRWPTESGLLRRWRQSGGFHFQRAWRVLRMLWSQIWGKVLIINDEVMIDHGLYATMIIKNAEMLIFELKLWSFNLYSFSNWFSSRSKVYGQEIHTQRVFHGMFTQPNSVILSEQLIKLAMGKRKKTWFMFLFKMRICWQKILWINWNKNRIFQFESGKVSGQMVTWPAKVSKKLLNLE